MRSRETLVESKASFIHSFLHYNFVTVSICLCNLKMDSETSSELVEKEKAKKESADPNIEKKDHQHQHPDDVEQKVWGVVQGVPGLNVGYGAVRLVVYITKGNKEQAKKSVWGIAKGLIQSAAIVGSVFIAPVLTAVAAGALTGIITESIQGAAHVVIFIVENSAQLRTNPALDNEKLIHEGVKEVPTLGAAYNIARAPAYAVGGDAKEAKISGIEAASGSLITGINQGINFVPGLNPECKGLLQSISQSLITILSRKILDNVAKEEISLEEGLNIVKTIQENCDSLEIISLEDGEMIHESELGEKEKGEEIEVKVERIVVDLAEHSPETEASMNTSAELPSPSSLMTKMSKLLKRKPKKATDDALLVETENADPVESEMCSAASAGHAQELAAPAEDQEIQPDESPTKNLKIAETLKRLANLLKRKEQEEIEEPDKASDDEIQKTPEVEVADISEDLMVPEDQDCNEECPLPHKNPKASGTFKKFSNMFKRKSEEGKIGIPSDCPESTSAESLSELPEKEEASQNDTPKPATDENSLKNTTFRTSLRKMTHLLRRNEGSSENVATAVDEHDEAENSTNASIPENVEPNDLQKVQESPSNADNNSNIKDVVKKITKLLKREKGNKGSSIIVTNLPSDSIAGTGNENSTENKDIVIVI